MPPRPALSGNWSLTCRNRGAAGPVFAKQHVIAERVAKEAEPVEPAADGFAFVRVARHAGDDRDVRIDAMADRDAFVRFDDAIILLDPLCGLVGVEKRKRQGTEPVARGQMNRLAA